MADNFEKILAAAIANVENNGGDLEIDLSACSSSSSPAKIKQSDVERDWTVIIKPGLSHVPIDVSDLTIRKLKIDFVGFSLTTSWQNFNKDHFAINAAGLCADEVEITLCGANASGSGNAKKPARLALDFSGAKIRGSTRVRIFRKPKNVPDSLRPTDIDFLALGLPQRSGGVFINAAHADFGGDLRVSVERYSDTGRLSRDGKLDENQTFDAVLDLKQADVHGDLVVERQVSDDQSAKKPCVSVNAPQMKVMSVFRLQDVSLWDTSDKSPERAKVGLDLTRARIEHLELDNMGHNVVPDFRDGSGMGSASPSDGMDAGLEQCVINTLSDRDKKPNGVLRRSSFARSEIWSKLAHLQPHGRRRTLRMLANAQMRWGEYRVADALLEAEKKLELDRDKEGWSPARWSEWWKGDKIGFLLVVLVFIPGAFFVFLKGSSVFGASREIPWFFQSANIMFVFVVAVIFVGYWLWTRPIFREKRRESGKIPTSIGPVELAFNWIVYKTIRGGIRPLRSVSVLLVLFVNGVVGGEILSKAGAIVPDRLEITSNQAGWHTVDILYREMTEPEDDNTDKAKRHRALLRGVASGHTLPYSWTDPRYPVHTVVYGTLAPKPPGPLDLITNEDLFSVCRRNWTYPDLIGEEHWTSGMAKRIDYRLEQLPEKQKKKLRKGHLETTEMTEAELTSLFRPEKVSKACARFIPAEYSSFNSVIYAFDVLIPLLDLRQEKEWSIRATSLPKDKLSEFEPNVWYTLAIFIEAAMIICGWLIALTLAGAVTGLSDPRRRTF